MVWHGVHLAAIARQVGALEAYVRDDAALADLKDDAYGMTPLIWACVMGHTEVARWLLDRGGAAVNLLDNGGRSALFYAAKIGYAPIVHMLLDRGACVRQPSVEGMTCLIIAAACGHEEVVRSLLDHVASPAFFATGGQSSSQAASAQPQGDGGEQQQEQEQDPAEAAAQEKARLAYIDAVTRRGNSAVHCASRHPAILKLLLAAGANPTLPNNEGHSPLNIALGKGIPPSIRLLKKHLGVAESKRVWALHKARALSDTEHSLGIVAEGARTRGEKRKRCLAVAPAYVRARIEKEAPLPTVAVANEATATQSAATVAAAVGGGGSKQRRQQQQRRRRAGAGAGANEEERRRKEAEAAEVRRAVAAHVATEGGLKQELYIELLDMMLPRWDAERVAHLHQQQRTQQEQQQG